MNWIESEVGKFKSIQAAKAKLNIHAGLLFNDIFNEIKKAADEINKNYLIDLELPNKEIDVRKSKDNITVYLQSDLVKIRDICNLSLFTDPIADIQLQEDYSEHGSLINIDIALNGDVPCLMQNGQIVTMADVARLALLPLFQTPSPIIV